MITINGKVLDGYMNSNDNNQFIEKSNVDASNGQNKCPRCGFENLNESNSCTNCGMIFKNLNTIQTSFNQNTYSNDVQPTFNQEINLNKNNKKILLIIVAILVVGIFVGTFIIFKPFGKNALITNLKTGTSFFIKDNDKYALFNSSGKQLTSFKFSDYYSFNYNSALVKLDDKYGIISSSGKMLVDFGKYKKIEKNAALYVATNNDEQEYLLDNNGRLMFDLSNKNLDTYTNISEFVIVKDYKDKKYSVINYSGKNMVSFPVNDGVKTTPKVNIVDEYVSVFYDDKNYILDINSGKEIASFEADIQYCVHQVDDDGKIITLSTCTSWYGKQDQIYHKLIKNGKLYNIKEQCDNFIYNKGIYMCAIDSKTYILNDELELGLQVDDKAYINENTYVIETSTFTNQVKPAQFYSNGNLLKTIECRELAKHGYMQDGLFLLKTYSSSCGIPTNSYEFYDSNAENKFGKAFKKATLFDDNKLSIVSEDGENYYLMNLSGKKVSNDYDKITFSKDYYIVEKNKLYGLVDKDGKELIECTNINIDIDESLEKKYAKVTKTNDEYITYSLNSRKEITISNSKPKYYNNYIIVEKNNIQEYYTYDGKKFFER